jgi:hypothetical protein
MVPTYLPTPGLCNSVADPDPYVFEPPGSGSINPEVRIRILLTSSKTVL